MPVRHAGTILHIPLVLGLVLLHVASEPFTLEGYQCETGKYCASGSRINEWKSLKNLAKECNADVSCPGIDRRSTHAGGNKEGRICKTNDLRGVMETSGNNQVYTACRKNEVLQCDVMDSPRECKASSTTLFSAPPDVLWNINEAHRAKTAEGGAHNRTLPRRRKHAAT